MVVTLSNMTSASAPWGDYGSVLWHGVSEVDGAGRCVLSRCGSFVPPITFPWPEVVVTEEFGREILDAGFVGPTLAAVELGRIVALEWSLWDQAAADPREFPAGGEPENYLARRKHHAATAAKLPKLFWLKVPILDGLMCGDSVDLARYDGSDMCRASARAPVVVSERASAWLQAKVPQWIRLAPCRVR